MSQITFEDKVPLNNNSSIPRENKVTVEDINEIKRIVNEIGNATITQGNAILDSTYISSIEGNLYSKVGNVVTYAFTATVKGTWGNTITFGSGLPKPKEFTRFVALDTSNSDKPWRCAINKNGELKNWYSSVAPTNGHIIEGYVTYISID